MQRLICCMAIAMLLLGCATKTKLVPVVEYRDRITTDTTVVRDSVYISRTMWLKGDTVFIHDTLRTYLLKNNMINVYVHDSIPYEVPVEVPVRVRNGYDRFTSWGFWLLAALLLLRVGWWVFKKVYLHR